MVVWQKAVRNLDNLFEIWTGSLSKIVTKGIQHRRSYAWWLECGDYWVAACMYFRILGTERSIHLLSVGNSVDGRASHGPYYCLPS